MQIIASQVTVILIIFPSEQLSFWAKGRSHSQCQDQELLKLDFLIYRFNELVVLSVTVN